MLEFVSRSGSAMRTLRSVMLAAAIGALASCHSPVSIDDIDAAQIASVERDAGAWWTTGGTYAEQHFSPLDKINDSNVGSLGLAWEADLESPRFGIEATPVIVDGVLYISSTWGRVFAFDARSGKRLWMFNPEVSGGWLRNGCCKPVNRGVAVWKGKVFVGALDGRLIAIDAHTGRKVWEANTTDSKPYYTITGAPRVVKGKVIIGNAGADFGMRGFFSAYDAETGKMAWRFYVVPGDPKKGYETSDVAAAAKTWNPNRDWSVGGGGNPWDSFAYDPKLNLLYAGTGNAGPFGKYNPAGGDGLYLSSIIAVNPDTGKRVWHYQTTPGDSWDYTATQNMVLADIKINGRDRKVIMQAPKNGFFYVLDRETGELLKAKSYVQVNWASGIDMKTGRPILTGMGDYRQETKVTFPSSLGGHNWHPMAFNPMTGLVYIPAREEGFIWNSDKPTWFTQGMDVGKLDPKYKNFRPYGQLIAWDPVAQKPAWTVRLSGIMNGGVLTTAGNLVVEGTEDGHLKVYSADKGKLLKDIHVGTGIVAPPVSYEIDGVQYIAVAAGWNGVKTVVDAPDAPAPYDNAARLLVLKLDGGAVRVAERVPLMPFIQSTAAQPASLVRKGAELYQVNCAMCHGTVGERSVMPDLRRMNEGTLEHFDDVVRGGLFEANGMANFSDVISVSDAQALKAFVIDWAQRSKRGDQRPWAESAALKAHAKAQ